MPQEFQWLHMSLNLYNVVSIWSACTQNRNDRQLKKNLKLFSTNGKVNIVVVGILCPFLCTAKRMKYVLRVMGSYTKLITVVSAQIDTASNTTGVLLNQWIILCSIPAYTLSDNCLLCKKKLSATICAMLVKKLLKDDRVKFTERWFGAENNGIVVNSSRPYVAES